MKLYRGAKLYSREIFTDELIIYKINLILKVLHWEYKGHYLAFQLIIFL